MEKAEAVAYTNAATNHLVVHLLDVGLAAIRWPTLVHDTLSFAEGIAPARVEEIFHNFREMYWLLCAEKSIRPHDVDEAKWRAALAQYDR